MAGARQVSPSTSSAVSALRSSLADATRFNGTVVVVTPESATEGIETRSEVMQTESEVSDSPSEVSDTGSEVSDSRSEVSDRRSEAGPVRLESLEVCEGRSEQLSSPSSLRLGRLCCTRWGDVEDKEDSELTLSGRFFTCTQTARRL